MCLTTYVHEVCYSYRKRIRPLQSEPGLSLGLVSWDTVSDADCPDTLNVGTEIIGAVVGLGGVGPRPCRRSADSKHVGPLLEGLVVVGWEDGGINRAVPEFYAKVSNRNTSGKHKSTYERGDAIHCSQDPLRAQYHPTAAQS